MISQLMGTVASSMFISGGGPIGTAEGQIGFLFIPPAEVVSGGHLGVTGYVERNTLDSHSGSACLNVVNEQGGVMFPDVSGTEFDLGAGDFTFEFWLKKNGIPPTGTSTLFNKFYSGISSQYGFRLIYDGANRRLQFQFSNTLVTTLRSSTHQFTAPQAAAFFDGSWRHIAVCRNGGDVVIYLDGVACSAPYTALGTDSIRNVTDQPFSLGVGLTSVTFASSYRTGLVGASIDDFRLTMGKSRYSAAFTPPVGAHPKNGADPDWSYVKALVDFEGSDWGFHVTGGMFAPDFILDSSGVDRNTAFSDGHGVKLGASLSWDAKFPYFEGYDLGSDDFTIETFIYMTTLSSGAILGPISSRNLYDCYGLYRGPSGAVQFRWTPDGVVANEITFTMGTLTSGSLQHFAVSRVGGTLYAHKNGVLTATGTISGAIHSGAANRVGFGVNGFVSPATTNRLPAGVSVNSFRVSTGGALYGAASFTPPVAADFLVGNAQSTVTLDPLNKDASISLSGGDLIAQKASGTGWCSARATKKVIAGKRYFEAKYTSFFSSFVACGIANDLTPMTNYLGSGTSSLGFVSNGQYFSGGVALGYSSAGLANGDTLCVAIDLFLGKFWVRINGGAWLSTIAGVQNPATGEGGLPVPANLILSGFYPGVSVQSSANPDTVELNASGPFAYTIPAGFIPI